MTDWNPAIVNANPKLRQSGMSQSTIAFAGYIRARAAERTRYWASKKARGGRVPIGIFLPTFPLLCALFLLAGCVDLAPARKHARIQAAANEGHAADESLPPAARAIGRVNADAWAAQVRHLGDE